MEKHPSKKKSAVNSESGEIVEPGEVKGEGQDISERKMVDEELRASEEKYRTLFNTVPQGVVYQNASGAEYGFVASIGKPIRKSELSEVLNRYMNTKK